MDLPQKLKDYVCSQLVPIDGLAPTMQSRLLAAAELQTFANGATLFEQGDEDDRVMYLIAGRLNILAVNATSYRMDADADEARYPLANLRPRQYSASAISACQVLCFPKALFDEVSSGQKSSVLAAGDNAAGVVEEGYDWMAGLLQSHIFSRIPTENIVRVLSVFEEVEIPAGTRVINEGDAGDYYYLVKEGRFRVTRRLKGRNKEVALADLHSGQGFGEEALLGAAPRNASVVAVGPGRLMRISKDNFLSLIRDPALTLVPFESVAPLVREGAQLLDVRLDHEVAAGGLKGAEHIPLHLLREGADRLDPRRPYVVFCDNGTRSAIAAFLLVERGFNVKCIRDGVGRELARRRSQSPRPAATRPGQDTAVPAPEIPASPLEDIRHLAHVIEDRSASMDELSRALSLVLASVYRQLELAVRDKDLAEQARRAAEERLAALAGSKNVA